MTTPDTCTVALVRGSDRYRNIREALALLGKEANAGKRHIVKPNFVSTKVQLAATHRDAAKAVIECLGKYNLDADVDALAREIEQELFQVHEDLLDPYPEFFTILAHIQQFPDIRAFILEGIDAYMLASTSIRAESDTRAVSSIDPA